MFFVDKPYISDFFKKTVRDNAIPVVDTDISKEMDINKDGKINILDIILASKNWTG